MTQIEAKKKLREFSKLWRINDFGYPEGILEIKCFDVIHNLLNLVETAINNPPKKSKNRKKKKI
jgi:hypothetical protein